MNEAVTPISRRWDVGKRRFRVRRRCRRNHRGDRGPNSIFVAVPTKSANAALTGRRGDVATWRWPRLSHGTKNVLTGRRSMALVGCSEQRAKVVVEKESVIF